MKRLFAAVVALGVMFAFAHEASAQGDDDTFGLDRTEYRPGASVIKPKGAPQTGGGGTAR